VICSTHNGKIKGLKPATGTGRDNSEKRFLQIILSSRWHSGKTLDSQSQDWGFKSSHWYRKRENIEKKLLWIPNQPTLSWISRSPRKGGSLRVGRNLRGGGNTPEWPQSVEKFNQIGVGSTRKCAELIKMHSASNCIILNIFVLAILTFIMVAALSCNVMFWAG
jgi:hypothetical protein